MQYGKINKDLLLLLIFTKVIQRRVNDKQDLYLGWDDYVRRFGNVEENFWIGKSSIFDLINRQGYFAVIFSKQNFFL